MGNISKDWRRYIASNLVLSFSCIFCEFLRQCFKIKKLIKYRPGHPITVASQDRKKKNYMFILFPNGKYYICNRKASSRDSIVKRWCLAITSHRRLAIKMVNVCLIIVLQANVVQCAKIDL